MVALVTLLKRLETREDPWVGLLVSTVASSNHKTCCQIAHNNKMISLQHSFSHRQIHHQTKHIMEQLAWLCSHEQEVPIFRAWNNWDRVQLTCQLIKLISRIKLFKKSSMVNSWIQSNAKDKTGEQDTSKSSEQGFQLSMRISCLGLRLKFKTNCTKEELGFRLGSRVKTKLACFAYLEQTTHMETFPP